MEISLLRGKGVCEILVNKLCTYIYIYIHKYIYVYEHNLLTKISHHILHYTYIYKEIYIYVQFIHLYTFVLCILFLPEYIVTYLYT